MQHSQCPVLRLLYDLHVCLLIGLVLRLGVGGCYQMFVNPLSLSMYITTVDGHNSIR